MLKDTLTQLEAKIKTSNNIPDEKKQEYYRLLEQLNSEINVLKETDRETAESVSGFTKISTHETTRQDVNPDLIAHSIEGLAESVREFEASHPRLVSTVNQFCAFLSKLGI